MKAFPLTLSLFAMTLAATRGAVVYSNTFDNGSTPTELATLSIGTVGWNALAGNASSPVITPTTTGIYRAGYADGTSAAANPTVTDYLYVQKSANSTTPGLVDIDFAIRTNDGTITPFAPSSFTSLTATWIRNGNTVAGHYFMIQRENAWYVSTTAYTSNGAGQSGAAPLDLLTTSWKNLDLSGGFLSIGSDTYGYADLFGLGESITGFGFYIDNLAGVAASATPGTSTFRLDGFVIEGVPEAGTSVMSLFGLSLLACRRRR